MILIMRGTKKVNLCIGQGHHRHLYIIHVIIINTITTIIMIIITIIIITTTTTTTRTTLSKNIMLLLLLLLLLLLRSSMFGCAIQTQIRIENCLRNRYSNYMKMRRRGNTAGGFWKWSKGHSHH